MILDEVLLHNFGVYRGKQSLKLTPPSADRPITLVGGLNGGGKTTLLEAIQLCLYGRHGRIGSRRGTGYDRFLRESIHRGADPEQGAAVELAFRHRTTTEEDAYRVRRTCLYAGSESPRTCPSS